MRTATYPPLLMSSERRLMESFRARPVDQRQTFLTGLDARQRAEMRRVLEADLYERARGDVISFAQAIRPDYRPAPFHRTIGRIVDDCIKRQRKRVIISLPAQHGKCWGLGERITTASGVEISVEDCLVGQQIRSVDPETLNERYETVVASQSNGFRPCRRLTTFSGRILTRTTNHPLLTIDGWRDVKDLVPGDFVAVARKMAFGTQKIDFGLAALMGYIIGDGCYTEGQIGITTVNPETVAHLQEICDFHQWRLTNTKLLYRITKIGGRLGKKADAPKHLIAQFMDTGNSYTKSIPECIFHAPAEDVADFLTAYFECDGHVWKQRAGAAVYYSVNKELLLGVQRLLMRFGVYSTLRDKNTKYKNLPFKSYQLIVGSIEDMKMFADLVLVRGSKRAHLYRVIDRTRIDRKTQSAGDSVPGTALKYLNHTTSWFRFKHGLRIDRRPNQVRMTRESVRYAAELENNDHLLWITSENVHWDMVTAVDDVGDIETWSLEVTGDHVVLSGDIIDHNSTIISRVTPPHIFGQNPDERIIATSYGGNLASEMNRDVQQIMDTTAYGRIYPGIGLSGSANAPQDVPGKWRQNDEVFDIVGHRGFYVCAGVGGAINGKSATFGIIDDYFKSWEEARSETYRARIWNWYKSTFFTRLQKDAVVAILCTRWHKEDLVGLVLEQARKHDMSVPWTVIELPAIMDRDPSEFDQRAYGDLLWPEEYSLDRYKEMPAYDDPAIWSAIYQCRPTTLGGGIWREAWWRYWVPPGMGRAFDPIEVVQPDGTFREAVVRELPALDRYGISADLTFGATGTSAVSMGVWADAGADTFRMDEVNGRMTFTEAKDALRGLADAYPEATAKLIEAKANGEATINALQVGVKDPAGRWIEPPIPGLIPIKPTTSKIERANDGTPFLRAGNVYLPHPKLAAHQTRAGLRVSGSANWVPAFKGESSDFPNGARNDRVDETSQWLAYRYLSQQKQEADAATDSWSLWRRR